MGTRSRTQVLDSNGDIIVSMYRQYDGYPAGAGADLINFIQSGKVVNGLGGDSGRVFNGIEDFAAQMVAHFKTEPGGFYLMAPKTRQELAEDIFIEYVYTVSFVEEAGERFGKIKGDFYLEVDDIHGSTFFEGSPQTFLNLLEDGTLTKLEEEAHGEKCKK